MAGTQPVEDGQESPAPSAALPPIIGTSTTSSSNPWARSSDPIPGISYSTPRPPPPPPAKLLPAPTADLEPAPIIGAAPPGSASSPASRHWPRRWVRSAKIAAAVLAIGLVLAASFGLRQTQTVNDQKTEIAGLNADLDGARSDVGRLETEVAAAERATQETADNARIAIGELQGRVDALVGERDVAVARVAELETLFPLRAATFDSADPTGGYTLDILPRPNECTGYSQPDSCTVNNFPGDLAITGDATAGFTVSSTWFAAFVLTDGGAGRLQGSGPANSNYLNTCAQADVPTQITVTLDRAAIRPVAGGQMKVVELAGQITVSTTEFDVCPASSRTADLTAALTG